MNLTARSSFSALLLAALAPAQTPAPVVLTPPANAILPWPTDRVLTDVVGNTVWATTATWKASFAADGATFVPCLGADVPSAPVRFVLREVRAGAATLHLGDAAPQLAEQRITQDHGGVREQFDLRQDGVEQSFVFDALPASGAVQLDLGVATTLAHASDANGHTFTDERGGVRYGNALAFDAAGHRIALETTWTGDALRLTVPANFVAAATLPLTVDPLIGAIVNATVANTVALSSTDIAFDQSLGQYFVSYERAFSATDHDVFVVPLDSNLQPQALLTIDFTNAYWSRPRIAVLEAIDRVGVVADVLPAGSTLHQVRMRQFTAGPGPIVDPVTTIDFDPTYDRLQPDVGGDVTTTPTPKFLVAYESAFAASNATDAAWALVLPSGVVNGHGYLTGPATFKRRAVVSKTCGKAGGGTEAWAIVARSEYTQPAIGQLQEWLVDRSGTVRSQGGVYSRVLTPLTDNAGSEWDVSSPTDHGNGRQFLCVERRYDPVAGRGALFAHVFDIVGNQPIAGALLSANNVDRRTPSVDSDGVRFAAAHANVYSSTDADVQCRTLAAIGNQLVVQDTDTVSFALDRDDQPALCAHTGMLNRYGVTWMHAAANAWTLQCQEYAGTGPGGVIPRTTACGGITISYSGSLALGESFSVTVNHQTGIGIVVAGGFANASIPGCSGCTLGVDGTAFTGSQLTVAVPANPALVGSVVSFQGARWDPLLGPCLGMLAFSNTLDVVVK